MPSLQAERSIGVTSPLGPDVLLFRRMSVTETLGRPFAVELDLYSEDYSILIDDVLGETMSVRLETESGEPRYFHGHVTQFSQVETPSTRFAAYQATLRPWFWLLTRTADCRIFRGTVPDIAKEVFQLNGFADFEVRLTGSYKPLDYCVQYRETAFNFLSRLFEQEGIYYYHLHDQQKHSLVLCDGYPSHQRLRGYGRIPYYPRDQARQREEEHINGWRLRKQVQPGVVVQRDYDFTQPKANLTTEAALPREHSRSTYEVFDYPGEYPDRGEGDRYSKIRIEELQVDYEQVDCECDVRGMATGGLFELTGFPRRDQNREYLVTGTSILLESNLYESGRGEGGGDVFHCSFTAIDSRETFRPARVTPKPVVQGPQTATVVGKAGEEIWTDKHGRITVQFHWDRYGKSDENSSCWIRVAHAWAGRDWGSIYIPRIGQEVIVEFLEGDPDRPIITGRVYNGDNRPPYSLPENKTVSTLKSRSSQGGTVSNCNEIKFEDKKGQELFFVQAEKDRQVKVKNDNSESVGNNETISVVGNRKLDVGKNEETKIGADRTEKVDGNESITVSGTRKRKVGGKESVTISGNRTLSVGGDLKVSTTGKHNDSAMEITLSGKTKITLRCGGSMITLEPAMITIVAPLVKINS